MVKSNAKRKRERSAHYEEHRAVIAYRKRWIEEHPDIANRPIGERPWDTPKEADRGAPWWGVKRMGPHGSVNHRSMFRHATRESAEQEAQFLAETFPGTVFVVLEQVAVHVVGEPEIRLGSESSHG
jgi:hypothetical protein